MSLTVTDLFCGAGGSSTGLTGVPGIRVRMAANHWSLAIETHNTNHPTTDHACADVSQVDPRLFPHTDILWGSPECTNHSQARGKKQDAQPDLFGDILPDEAAQRSRATMWDIPRFAEYHRYSAVITENVVDAARWAPFPAWLMSMETLGYVHKIVYANSMHAQAGGLPAPQSRDRMYVVFWRKGNRAPDLERWTRPKAHCPSCDETVSAIQSWKRPDRPPWGRYRAQYVWRCPKAACRNGIVEPGWLPASSAIDWALKGERIGDRAKPLAPKTMARIQAGLTKFCAAQLVPAGGTWRDASTPVYEPMPTRTTRETDGLLIPVEGRDGKSPSAVAAPMRTMTTRNETGLLVPYYGNGYARSTEDAVGTLTTRDRYAFVVPLRNHNTAKAVTEPLDTFAAAGQHHGLATTTVPEIADCAFRMLEPGEIARGMAFPVDYQLLGNKREKVRLAGNAVCPPNARDLGHAVAESLGVSA